MPEGVQPRRLFLSSVAGLRRPSANASSAQGMPMVFESAEGLRVQEFEARVQSPRPGLRSLESRQDTPGNSQPEGELREANQQMREYLAELGHDLRTPLATICDALHVLTLDGDDGATREYVGDLMERQTQRIGLLIDDLLEAS